MDIRPSWFEMFAWLVIAEIYLIHTATSNSSLDLLSSGGWKVAVMSILVASVFVETLLKRELE